MAPLVQSSKDQLLQRQKELQALYNSYKSRELRLDMSRGKPGADQLDISTDLLNAVNEATGFVTEDGVDTRNYGGLDGITEARRLFGEIMGMPPELVIVGGNSSLNMMFDYICTACVKGICGNAPWLTQGAVKFLCPAPGYDRHFAITQYFGIEMITVPMTENGPDMDRVEALVQDPAVKGMWCVPMYSNPQGVTYSDDTVRRIAALNPAAPDFRIMWDNAYCVHHLYEQEDVLLNLYREAAKLGHEDMVIQFASTSKISFPGAGVAALAASAHNLTDIRSRMTVQTIGFDKINMLRHTRIFPDMAAVKEQMKKHAAVMRPKFEVVLNTLNTELTGKGIARWHNPRGGYFVSVDLMPGTAKETIRLLKEAGVTMTPAGATYPYGADPEDSNLRIAPSYPPLNELQVAIDLFCICAELAAVEKLLAQ